MKMLQNLYKTFTDIECFSQSRLWAIVLHYYKKSGTDAWNRKVPFTVTNSSPAAFFHAQTIIQHVKQLPYQHKSYAIIDFGAGIGQHGFLLAKYLSELCQTHNIPLETFDIILADVSKQTICFWEQHPSLQPFIKQKLIKPTLLSGDWIQDLTTICEPYRFHCVIANYLLDSMPFIAFEDNIQQGISLSAPRKHLSEAFSGPLDTIRFKTRPIKAKLHPKYQMLQERYKHLKRYTIPTLAIEFIHTLFENSSNALFIANDKTFQTLQDIDYCEQFNLTLEGCFSTTINMDAILQLNPSLYHIKPSATNNTLNTNILCTSNILPTETMSCADSVMLFSHFKQQTTIPVPLCHALTKTLLYDPFCLEIMSQGIHSATQENNTALMIQQCLANHFPKPFDLTLLHIAKIYRKTGQFNLAFDTLEQFKHDNPNHSAYHFELGLLLLVRKKKKQAIEHFNLAAKDPLLQKNAQEIIDKVLSN